MVPVILDFSQACYIEIILPSASAFSTPLGWWPVYRPTRNNMREQSFNMAEEKRWCRTKIESSLTKWNWAAVSSCGGERKLHLWSCSKRKREGVWSRWFIAVLHHTSSAFLGRACTCFARGAPGPPWSTTSIPSWNGSSEQLSTKGTKEPNIK